MEQIKIGYKGFDKDLKCRGEQFEIGKVYSKPDKDKLNICSGDGYHYCNKIKDVFSYYSKDGQNRFCKIEVLGKFIDSGDKSITTSFKIIEELTSTLDEDALRENMLLGVVQSIQKKYPQFHVGGSIGLFLHGLRLKRWIKRPSSDIDMVSPYFILPESDEDHEVKQLDAKASANDFDETFAFDGTKVDYRIDPKQRYEIVEFEGFKYKVSPLEVIMEAKIRYALNGQKKHKDDLYELLGKKWYPKTEIKKSEPASVQSVDDDIPW